MDLNREEYYGSSLQPWDIMDDNPFMNFNIASAYKYIARIGIKNPEDIKKDSEKIINYLNHFETTYLEKVDTVTNISYTVYDMDDIYQMTRVNDIVYASAVSMDNKEPLDIRIMRMRCIQLLFVTNYDGPTVLDYTLKYSKLRTRVLELTAMVQDHYGK